MVTKAAASELLDLLIDRGEKLRKAGYSKVTLEGVAVELLPLEPEIPKALTVGESIERPTDPMKDPDTFGRKRVPSLGADT